MRSLDGGCSRIKATERLVGRAQIDMNDISSVETINKMSNLKNVFFFLFYLLDPYFLFLDGDSSSNV